MKTRMPKGWKLFGTNAQDALTPVERRNYDRKCLKMFQHMKKKSAKEWTDEVFLRYRKKQQLLERKELLEQQRKVNDSNE